MFKNVSPSQTQRRQPIVLVSRYTPLHAMLKSLLPSPIRSVRPHETAETVSHRLRPEWVVWDGEQKNSEMEQTIARCSTQAPRFAVLLPGRNRQICGHSVHYFETAGDFARHMRGDQQLPPTTFFRQPIPDDRLAWALVDCGMEAGLSPAQLDTLYAATLFDSRSTASEFLGISKHTHRKHIEAIGRKCNASPEKVALSLLRNMAELRAPDIAAE